MGFQRDCVPLAESKGSPYELMAKGYGTPRVTLPTIVSFYIICVIRDVEDAVPYS